MMCRNHKPAKIAIIKCIRQSYRRLKKYHCLMALWRWFTKKALACIRAEYEGDG